MTDCSPNLMKLEVSDSFPPEPATCPYPEPEEFSPLVLRPWYWFFSGIQPVLVTLPRIMVYPALLPLMRTPRLPVVD